jgi:PAS domain-containing protein
MTDRPKCRAAVLLGQRNRGKKKRITPELEKAMADRLAARRARRWLVLRDDDGQRVQAGDSVRFVYGIPPVAVVQRDGRLVALCPGHTPEECNLRTLRRHVGSWYKEGV